MEKFTGNGDEQDKWVRSVDKHPDTNRQHVLAAQHLPTSNIGLISDNEAESTSVQQLVKFGLLELRKATGSPEGSYEYRKIVVTFTGDVTLKAPLR
ncbi:hypothetical protein QGN31_23380 [Mycobacterium sp. 2-64]|uniref:hypothetical protein n=1 Tax=Mycobacterium sp. 2-64 TaxID=3042319 RepID=UPI002DDC8537|nr:hypothetical protein [Mycobacterium sp. 2-64]WSE51014.1 hypothetical protein QGN31_23380 [Mycobacterium sp. 2-64]